MLHIKLKGVKTKTILEKYINLTHIWPEVKRSNIEVVLLKRQGILAGEFLPRYDTQGSS